MSKTNFFYEKILTSLRVYYFTLAALINIYGLGQIKNFRADFKPVYLSVATLFTGLEYRLALLYSSLLLIGFCFIAALKVTWRWPKVAVSLALLNFAAVTNSTGGLTHLYQFWLWSSLMLIWAPTIKKNSSEDDQKQYLASWWGAQSIVLLMYGISGMWKCIGFIVQIFQNQTGIFMPSGLSYHLASEIIRAGADPILGTWLLAHPNLQPLLAIPTALIQLSCFVGIFNAGLRPYLAVALILFHLGTYFFLAINYPTNFALIPILFLLVPKFTPPWSSARQQEAH